MVDDSHRQSSAFIIHLHYLIFLVCVLSGNYVVYVFHDLLSSYEAGRHWHGKGMDGEAYAPSAYNIAAPGVFLFFFFITQHNLGEYGGWLAVQK